MNNSRVFIVILVLLIAGSAIAISSRPQTPPSAPPQPVSNFNPTFRIFPNLPVMLSLKIWSTATPAPTALPTVPLTPTRTPTPSGAPPPTPTSTPMIPPSPAPLSPSPTNPPAGACAWMDNGLPNVTEYYPNGSTSLPGTTSEICAFSGTQYYSLPFRNPNCQATQAGIDKAFERMKTYYPAYWQASKLKDDWQTVQHYARRYNFNPLFVIALWIEESAAGGATTAQKLGCVYRRNKDNTYTFMPPSSTVCDQMECLFGLQSANPLNYALWACQYLWGAGKWQNNHCLDVVKFTKGVEFWYNFIAEGLPSSCQIKYYSPADSGCL